ncbi:MAG: nuclear transport factor 2 family protein [Anaerolineae bacterium]
MNTDFENTWETYASSWKAATEEEKRDLFKKSLADNCVYNDPLAKAKGWDELSKYMLDFHQQVPGGHFVTTSFMSHSNKSIVTWEMKTGNNIVIGDGISYGEYNEQGLLTAMTGFFEPLA